MFAKEGGKKRGNERGKVVINPLGKFLRVNGSVEIIFLYRFGCGNVNNLREK